MILLRGPSARINTRLFENLILALYTLRGDVFLHDSTCYLMHGRQLRAFPAWSRHMEMQLLKLVQPICSSGIRGPLHPPVQ